MIVSMRASESWIRGTIRTRRESSEGAISRLEMRTRRKRSQRGDCIYPASILLHSSVRRLTPVSRVSVSLMKTSRMNALIHPEETPDAEPRLSEGKIVE